MYWFVFGLLLVSRFIRGLLRSDQRISSTVAFTDFADTIVPNSRAVVVEGQRVVGLGHENFVVPFTDVDIANPFGVDVFNAANANGFDPQGTWIAVCDLDSDGDGITNGVELCDPDCVNAGVSVVACANGAVLTHPGFPPGVVVGFEAPPYLVAHGILMIIAWLFIAPFGILRAVFYKKRPPPPNWFRDHKVALCLTVALTWLSFAIMVKNQGTDTIRNSFDLFPGEVRSSATGVHVVVGVFVLLISVLQPLSGYFRAHLPPKGEAKSNVRLLWEFQHQWTGRAGLVLAMICISTGLPLVFLQGKLAGNAFITIFVFVGICCFTYVLFFRDQHMAKLREAAESSKNGNEVVGKLADSNFVTSYGNDYNNKQQVPQKVASMSFRDSFRNVSKAFQDNGAVLYGKTAVMMDNLRSSSGFSPRPNNSKTFTGQQQSASFQKQRAESNMFDDDEEDDDVVLTSSRKSSTMRRSKKISYKDIQQGSDYYNSEAVDYNPRYSKKRKVRKGKKTQPDWAANQPLSREELGFRDGESEKNGSQPNPYKEQSQQSSSRYLPSATFNNNSNTVGKASLPPSARFVPSKSYDNSEQGSSSANFKQSAKFDSSENNQPGKTSAKFSKQQSSARFEQDQSNSISQQGSTSANFNKPQSSARFFPNESNQQGNSSAKFNQPQSSARFDPEYNNTQQGSTSAKFKKQQSSTRFSPDHQNPQESTSAKFNKQSSAKFSSNDDSQQGSTSLKFNKPQSSAKFYQNGQNGN